MESKRFILFYFILFYLTYLFIYLWSEVRMAIELKCKKCIPGFLVSSGRWRYQLVKCWPTQPVCSSSTFNGVWWTDTLVRTLAPSVLFFQFCVVGKKWWSSIGRFRQNFGYKWDMILFLKKFKHTSMIFCGYVFEPNINIWWFIYFILCYNYLDWKPPKPLCIFNFSNFDFTHRQNFTSHKEGCCYHGKNPNFELPLNMYNIPSEDKIKVSKVQI